MLGLLSLLSFILAAQATVTIYTQFPGDGLPSQTTSPLASETNPAVFDPTVLIAPSPPNPSAGGTTVVQLRTNDQPGLSIKIPGGFLGLSIEMSVTDQYLGKNGSFINPQFLNLLETLSRRSGRAVVRIGGNSQEKAVFFPDGLPNGETITKDKSNVKNPTDTPTLDVGIDMLFAMANISSLTKAQWFVGAPFDTPATPRLGITESSQRILGENLLGMQVGNEPDLFGDHGDRPNPYTPQNYVDEMHQYVTALTADTSVEDPNDMIVPSTCCNFGIPELQQAGFIDAFNAQIRMLSVEHYPTDNCPDANGNKPNNGQDIFGNFLNHGAVVAFVNESLTASQIAQQIGKPLMMMETNTASCGGFPGLSDSFGAALWILDTSMQLASLNFSGSLLHFGGQNTYYNPFTPPGGAQVKRGAQWTVSSPFYAMVMMAELIGSSNNAQVADIFPNNGNQNTPGYAVYENGVPVRALFINYVTDPSGANDYTAQIAVDGSGLGRPNASPSQVFVRYFTSNTTASKLPFFYANQTFGDTLKSNGILEGTLDTQTVDCDVQNNLCSVKVPAPGAVVVFFSQDAADQSQGQGVQEPFSTTVVSVDAHNTATIDPEVLATSNGYGGLMNEIGSTSFGSTNDVKASRHASLVALACVALGGLLVGRILVR